MMQNQFLVAVDPARQTAKNQSGNLMKNKINHEYSSVELWSPRNMTGTWIGNTWIPPSPWRQFSAADTAYSGLETQHHAVLP